jgi:hypothetical protein
VPGWPDAGASGSPGGAASGSASAAANSSRQSGGESIHQQLAVVRQPGLCANAPLSGSLTLRKHRELLLNWYQAEGTVSARTVEGFNNKAKRTLRKPYGFREYSTIEWAPFHQLGALPEPTFTHEFC